MADLTSNERNPHAAWLRQFAEFIRDVISPSEKQHLQHCADLIDRDEVETPVAQETTSETPNPGVIRYHHSLSQCDMVESTDGIYVLYEALVNENKARRDIAKELARVTDAYFKLLGDRQQVETPVAQALKEQQFREALARIAAGFYTEQGAERHAKDIIRIVDAEEKTIPCFRGKPCTCDNCLGSSVPCRVDAGERLGELWYCRKAAESSLKSTTEPVIKARVGCSCKWTDGSSYTRVEDDPNCPIHGAS